MPLIYYIPIRSAVTGEITYVANPSTSLLLSANISPLSFNVDSSNFSNEITVVGDARASNYTPYIPTWSAYFNGTTDYLWRSANSAFSIVTADFTIEGWVYPTSWAGSPILIGYGGSAYDWSAVNGFQWLIQISATGQLVPGVNTGSNTYTSITGAAGGVPLNTWTHFALVRSGTTMTAYINGTSIGSVSVASAYIPSAPQFLSIGSGAKQTSPAGTNYFAGYMSNLRIVKGTAVYTANFIPTSTPLTAISGTSLLTLQSNRFIDNSPNNFTLTKTGDTQITPFSSFTTQTVVTPTTYSTYFDGTGDYIHTTSASSAFNYGTGAFTIEFWVYPLSGPVSTYNPAFFTNHGDGSWNATGKGIRIHHQNALIGASTLSFTQAVQNGRWSHVAIVRNGNTVTAYLNGVANGTLAVLSTTNLGDDTDRIALSTSDSITTGGREFLNGYISNLRVVKGTAVYTANFTTPTSSLSSISGTSLLTCQNSTLIDNSSNAFTITSAGQAQPNIANPFGSSLTTNNVVTTPTTYSTYFDGTGDYLSVPSNSAFAFGTGDFTIECWINFPANSTYRQIFSLRPAAGTNASEGSLAVNPSNGLIWYTGGIIVNYTTSIGTNQWVHIALSRVGTTLRVFANGVLVGSATNSDNLTATNFSIGANNNGSEPFTGCISNLRVVKGTAVYTANFTPPTSPLTAIAGTSLLTCQNATLIDNSSNAFAITSAGQAQPNIANPFGSTNAGYSSTYTSALSTPTTYSNYYNGTTDYLSIASNAALSFGTGDFTLECWIWISSPSDSPIYEGRANGTGTAAFTLTAFSSSVIRVWTGTAALISSSGTTYINKWTHVAVVRSSGTTKLYIDGTSVGSSTSLGNLTESIALIGGGRYGSTSTVTKFFPGYISNFRMVKGTAVYTANFTPPTSPLTAVSGTSLLTCQSSSIVDNSTNAFTITTVGNTTISRVNPFGFASAGTVALTKGSAYFDGTGDYLSVPASQSFNFGTGDHTIEAFIYWDGTYSATGRVICATGGSGSADQFGIFSSGGIYYAGLSSNASPPSNAWSHVAVSRQGSTVRFFVNGVLVATGTNANAIGSSTAVMYVGVRADGNHPWFGYISNLRIVKGTAVYTSNFLPSTDPLTVIPNTVLLTCQNSNPHNNHTFINSVTGTSNLVLSRSGNATQGSLSPYAASWGGYLDGSGDYLSVASNAAFALGTSYTIELWHYRTGTASTGSYTSVMQLLNTQPYGSPLSGFMLTYDGGSVFNFRDSAGSIILSYSSTNLSLNTWYHVAIVRNGSGTNNVTMYINGISVVTGTSSGTQATAVPVYIGGDSNGNCSFPGYISNLRIVKGTAVYTANFTPSTAPLTAISGTSLLTLQNDQFIDNSSNRFALTLTGTPKPALNNNTQFALNTLPTPTTYSTYFDGTGDYLTVPDNAALEHGNSNLTWEMWIKTSSTTYFSWLYARFPSSLGAGMWALITNLGAPGEVALYLGDYSTTTPLLWSAAGLVNDNNWHHVAVVRNANNWTLYIDGISRATATWAGTISDISSGPTIGGGSTIPVGNPFTGYISNLRVVKGTALYTAAFTPPTAPLTAVSGTSLLTCQNATLIDNSSNAFTITSFGQAQPSAINPVGSTSATVSGYSVAKFKGSAYFNGGTTSINAGSNAAFAIRTGDFTVEAWVYHTSATPTSQFISAIDTSGGLCFGFESGNFLLNKRAVGTDLSYAYTIPTNTWVHYAASRQGTTARLFINGVQVASGTVTTNYSQTGPLAVGAVPTLANYGVIGYISNFRLVNGTAIYTSNFLPTSTPLTPTANTVLLLDCSAGSIVDATGKNVVETVGDAKISNKIVKYGNNSMYFDGAGDYLTLPYTTSLNMPTNFTIEAWVYPIAKLTNFPCIVNNYSTYGANGGIGLFVGYTGYDTKYTVAFNGVHPAITSTSTIQYNQWVHLAVVRSGTTITLYVNGVANGTATNQTATLVGTANSWWVGAAGTEVATAYFNGYISDLRVTKGSAVYTTNFTPPTTPLLN